MSYDLHIHAPDDDAPTRDELIAHVRSTLAKRSVEVRPSSEWLLSVGLSAAATDALVRRVYADLVELAKAHGLRLHDPQSGTDVDLASPGRIPPGWVPSLTFAQARKLTQNGRFSELLQELYRVRDPNMTDRKGEPLINVVLFDAWNRGPNSRSFDGRPLIQVAEDVALSLLERGANPLLESPRGAHALYWAVATDSSRLTRAILASLDDVERKAVLAEKRDGKTWIDHAISRRAKATEKVLRRAAGK